MTIMTAVVKLVRQVASCEDKAVEYLHKLKLLIEKSCLWGGRDRDCVGSGFRFFGIIRKNN